MQKAKTFIQQIDNKIADVAEMSSGRKIRYATSLLREIAAEWTSIHLDEERNITFDFYKTFRKSFLKRFTDPNSTETAMERLLNLKREKINMQEYTIKALNLSHQADLRDQTTKTLVFQELHSKDQDRVMLANSIKTETELQKKTMEIYLERITRLLRREKIRRQKERQEDSI